MQRIKSYFGSIGNQLKNYLDTHSFPGLNGISIWRATKFFFKELQEEILMIRAAAIAFHTILSAFPMIIFIFTLIPYVPIKHFQEILFVLTAQILPKNAYELLYTTIEDIISIPRGGLLSINFIMAIWFSTNGVNFFIHSLHKNSREYRNRGFIKNRWLAMRLTFIMIFMLLTSIFLIIVGNSLILKLLNYWEIKSAFTVLIFTSLRWLIILLFFFFSIACLFYYGSGMKGKWRFFSPGATMATIGTIATSLGFSFFVNNFGRYNKFYGSVGTVIVFMIWVYINSLVMLIGYELNEKVFAYIDHKKKQMLSNG